jgi:hypothetical protein
MKFRHKQIFRGAIGGILGHLLKMGALTVYCLVVPDTYGMYTVIVIPALLILGIPTSLFTGAVIGFILNWIIIKFDYEPRIYQRIIVGVIFTGLICGLINLIDYLLPETNRWSLDNFRTYLILPICLYDFGLIIGSIAGIFAEARSETKLK